MKKKHPFWIVVPLFVLVIVITACSGEAGPVTKPVTEDSEDLPSLSPSTEQESQVEMNREETKSFEMMTAEGNQSLDGRLNHGEGFSVYVFEKFTFDAATGRLSLSSNPDYSVEIEPLPADYDLDQLEAAAIEELSQIGEVSDYSGELVEHPLRSAKLYLQASGENGISDYMVWTSEQGDAFEFRLHNPKGEEASDFAGPVIVSLSTVQKDM
ncbi:MULTISPECIES: hypothetical protein [unclassified Paenibacillus]|uniref:hypothetical protein n=1 Tax=Paenibacillus sp. 453mf TaxID=1761874 RepID=UPI0008E43756|nr:MULTISPECIES: hypothetical protein [unclassified Paenibacillus]MCM3127096.1 hypothetical protein [Paenibacillus sp. MER 78]SFS56009.1 hypothetical protein SAMN04488601_1011710 [Paenibacillus sp. 453mf]